jgi:hypothetical protein
VNVRRELRRLQAPGEPDAQARAWEVVRSTYRARATGARREHRWKLVVVPALTAAVLAVVLTPAGATVSRVISHAIAPPPAEPILALPSHGKLLLSGLGGTWIVAPDGTRSRVGSWRQASWSPHARYIVVASRNRLAAVTQGGEIEWELSRPAVSDPSWFAPSGFRVAYRSGSSLRVVAGDGTGDRLLARGVSAVAPAWRPNHPFQLAYIHNGHVVLRGADSGRLFWSRSAGSAIKLQWSADGNRLLLLTRDGARVLSASGQTETTIKLGGANRLISGSIAPDGKKVALVRSQGVQIAHLAAGTTAPGAALSSVLPGGGIRDVTWSPNSRWLLISWPTANEWVFLATGQRPHLEATSRIAQRFGHRTTGRLAHRSASTELPELDGWCCTAGASTPGQHSARGATKPVKASAASARPLAWSQRLRASTQALIDELAPLRRPQTVSERAFAQTLKSSELPFYYFGTIDRSLVRYATTTPWGPARLPRPGRSTVVEEAAQRGRLAPPAAGRRNRRVLETQRPVVLRQRRPNPARRVLRDRVGDDQARGGEGRTLAVPRAGQCHEGELAPPPPARRRGVRLADLSPRRALERDRSWQCRRCSVAPWHWGGDLVCG